MRPAARPTLRLHDCLGAYRPLGARTAPHDHDNDYDDGRGRSGGFFSRRRSCSSSDDYGRGNNKNLKNEPTIRAARQKVTDAEAYEREADRALGAARAAVREAREHVRLLEREALEE